jgi:acetolactate synthase-1/2/3 large subunit
MKQTAAEWLAGSLRARGVEWMAALCGHGLDPLFHALDGAGIRLIDTRNEQTAGYIAEAYGRLMGKPGVYATSSGVAAINGLTGALNAWFDRAPMLMISGSANLSTLGMGCFQDLDQVSMARPVTKYSRTIDSPSRTVQLLDEAWQCAMEAPRGPVHLMFPMDVQRAEVAEPDLVKPNVAAAAAGISKDHVEAAARLLGGSSKPLIIAGSGAFYNRQAGVLMALAERFSIPVQTPIWDRGVCDRSSDAFLGVIGAATGGPDLLGRADGVLLAGVEGDYRVGYLQQAANVGRLDYGWEELAGCLAASGCQGFAAWLDEARRLRSDYTARVREAGEKQKVAEKTHAVDIVSAIEQTLPEDATLIIDGGSIGQWAHQLLCDRRYPGFWLTCGRSGVVGYGIAGAMAARLAFPDRPVALLSGDGAFTFTVAELECAVRQKLPFTAIVADDQCWGITHSGHLRQFGTGIGTELGPIRFDMLAKSLGARGVRVDQAGNLAEVVGGALRSAEVTVIHVPIVGGNPV